MHDVPSPRRVDMSGERASVELTVAGDVHALASDHEEGQLVRDLTSVLADGSVLRLELRGGGVLLLNGRTVRSVSLEVADDAEPAPCRAMVE